MTTTVFSSGLRLFPVELAVTQRVSGNQVVFYTGTKFDLREFHDAVLMQSSLPLSILETIIDEYIDSAMN